MLGQVILIQAILGATNTSQFRDDTPRSTAVFRFKDNRGWHVPNWIELSTFVHDSGMRVQMQTEIRNSGGEKLDYSFHAGKSGNNRLLIIGHGVTGNKDRPFVVALAAAAAQSGIPCLRFSFAGNGQSEGRFIDATITKEVQDLGAVLDAATQAGYEITYAGHSMGGAVGVLRASSDPRIHRLISLAGMVHTKAFAEREFGMVKPDAGFMWDDDSCPLSQAYMDDTARIGSVLHLGATIRVPWLLVHGTEDDVVPISDSREIHAQAGPPAKLKELVGANHVFKGEEHTKAMIDVVLGWLEAGEER